MSKPIPAGEVKAKLVVREAWLEVPDNLSVQQALELAKEQGYNVIKVDGQNRRLQIKIGAQNGS